MKWLIFDVISFLVHLTHFSINAHAVGTALRAARLAQIIHITYRKPWHAYCLTLHNSFTPKPCPAHVSKWQNRQRLPEHVTHSLPKRALCAVYIRTPSSFGHLCLIFCQTKKVRIWTLQLYKMGCVHKMHLKLFGLNSTRAAVIVAFFSSFLFTRI